MFGNAIFLIIIGGWNNFMFCNNKFSGFGRPYNLFKYSKIRILFQIKLCGNVSIQMDLLKNKLLNRRNNRLYSSHRENKAGTSMWNAWALWIFALLHASSFIITTEDIHSGHQWGCNFHIINWNLKYLMTKKVYKQKYFSLS